MASAPDEESIFTAAMQFRDAEVARSAYLASVCGDNIRLRQRVERLLSAYAAAEYLEDPVADVVTTSLFSVIGEKPGDMIGPYKLLEQIGEGGMGLVFMAEQTQPLRRRVALKIIKPGLDTRAVMARFEVERQALALMDHQNIARVYDAGATDTGRPYFVMELVRGSPITDYCRDRGLGLRDRLQLFIEVCDAVQHAHQKGVIHRDLKPTNILISHTDTAPIAKVIDFGVAKATTLPLTDHTLFTAFSQIIGTPLYMSPEQADRDNQDVDTRSDVYSLGVVLYELLTDTTPVTAEQLRGAPDDEMRRIIREEEPPRPSIRATTAAAAVSTIVTKSQPPRHVDAHTLKGDLDWIVMKTLEKDRRRRYESPNAVAADIKRHLNNEPIEAFPPTRRYRLVKVFRRNRVTILFTAAVTAALVIGLGASVWQAVRAVSAERRSNVALNQARLAVDDMYTEVAEKWLETQGALTDVQQKLLGKSLRFYRDLAAQTGASGDVQNAAHALLRIGRIHQRLGEHAEAELAFQQAIDEYEGLFRVDDERLEYHMGLVDGRTRLAGLYHTTGRTEYMIKQADLAAEHFDTLRQIKFDRVEDRERLARLLSSLASVLSISNRREEARDVIGFAVDAWSSLIAEFPENFDYRYGFALAKARQGSAQMWWRSNDSAAERDLREADALLTTLLKERPRDVDCRRALARMVLTDLGTLLNWADRSAEAVELDRRCLALTEALAAEFQDDELDQDGYVTSLRNLATTLEEAGKGGLEEVDLLYARAYEVSQDLVRRFPASVRHKDTFLQAYIGIARGLHVKGKHREALEFCRGALPDLAAILKEPGNDRNLGLANECLSLLAALHIDFSDHAAAGSVLRLYSHKRFDRNFENRLGLPTRELKSKLISDYLAQAFVLLKPALLYDECIRLASEDQSLSAEERVATCDSYRAKSRIYFEEGRRAVEAWGEALDVHGDAGAFRAAYHGELQIVEMLNWQSDRRTSPTWRTAQSATCRTLVQELVGLADRQLAEQPAQYVIAQLLITAPSELRNDALALEFARRAVGLAPTGTEANFTMGWALYRSGQWRDCVNLLNKPSEDVSGASLFVMGMALWQLDRKDEARQNVEQAARLFESYKKSVNDNLAAGRFTFPLSSMVARLYDEAIALLSSGASAQSSLSAN
ncbi:MAG: protein kinase [Pirellulales bacterium]